MKLWCNVLKSSLLKMETSALIMQHSRYRLQNSLHMRINIVKNTCNTNNLSMINHTVISFPAGSLQINVSLWYLLILIRISYVFVDLHILKKVEIILSNFSFCHWKYVVCVIAGICCSVGAAAGWLSVCPGRRDSGVSGEETSSWTLPISGWHLLINLTFF